MSPSDLFKVGTRPSLPTTFLNFDPGRRRISKMATLKIANYISKSAKKFVRSVCRQVISHSPHRAAVLKKLFQGIAIISASSFWIWLSQFVY